MPMNPGEGRPGWVVIFTATSASIVPSWKLTPGSGRKPSTPSPRRFTSRTALRPRNSAVSIVRPLANRPLVSASGNVCREGSVCATARVLTLEKASSAGLNSSPDLGAAGSGLAPRAIVDVVLPSLMNTRGATGVPPTCSSKAAS